MEDNLLFDVKQAYRKLKSYIYYDNNNLFYREQIADFENDVETTLDEKLIELADWLKINRKNLNLNKKRKKNDFFWSKIENIDFYVVPKKIEKPQKYSVNIVTNRTESEDFKVSKVTYFIKCDVVLHIICVLWIMKIGYLLDDNKYCYGYRLSKKMKSNKIAGGLKLFEPYFIKYSQWRDKALEVAEHHLKEQTDVAIIGLDIKNYFHSVDFEFDKLNKALQEKDAKAVSLDSFYTNLLKEIHLQYSKKITDVTDENLDKTILPIGLLSSGILANWYLNSFDENVIENLNPAYYGRYVDDILIVIRNPKINYDLDSKTNGERKSENAKSDFINRYFVKKNILEHSNQNKAKYKILGLKSEFGKIENYSISDLYIQDEKIHIKDFDSSQSKAILEKFKLQLRKNQSEYRFLPVGEEINEEFDEAAYNLYYTGSENKLGSIKEFEEDKYGAAKFLANKILSSTYSHNNKDEKTNRQLLTFFKGRQSLAFYSLWERVSTYFLLNKQQENLYDFFVENYSNIQKLKSDNGKIPENIIERIKQDMIFHLNLSISMSLALNPKFIDKENFKRKLNKFGWVFEKGKASDSLTNFARIFRQSNLLRHSLVFHPLLNYTKYAYANNPNPSPSLIDSQVPKEESDLSLVLKMQEYSPRFVHFDEVVQLQILKMVNNGFKKGENNTSNDLGNRITDFITHNLKESFKEFYKFNYLNKYDIQDDEKGGFEKLIQENYFRYDRLKLNDISIGHLTVGTKVKKDKINIAIANIKINPADLLLSVKKTPNLSKSRQEKIFELLNLVEKENCDALILPETSIPYSWLPILIKHSRKRQRAITFGMEHWIQGGMGYNFIVTLLPVIAGGIKSCIPSIRLKNHYSHAEKRFIKGYSLNIPKPAPAHYDLFIWNNIYFSVYNCFELADINHRAIFRSEVDLIVASEYNRDTNYFSNIVESAARDIHCYFAQVNSSDFGDSRITKPAKTAFKNMLQIKGGENTTILTAKLDIKALREFQLKKFELQDLDKDKPNSFKATPPDYDIMKVKERLNIK